MIPVNERGNIVMSSIMFIRAITKAYGSEEGMELWSRIAEVLDPAIKGEVFKAMLVGEYEGLVRIKGLDSSKFDKIGVIKLIRNTDKRRLDLKEAIEVIRGLEAGKSFDLQVVENNRAEVCMQLQSMGVIM